MNGIQAEYRGRVDVRIIDVDDPSNNGLVRQYNVRSIPRMVLIDEDERVLKSFNGLTPADRIRADLERALNR